MTLTKLQEIIMQAGGNAVALDYASELLTKIENVGKHQTPKNYLKQRIQIILIL